MLHWGAGKRRTLRSLPRELASLIVGCVEDIRDLVCLFLVHKTLFSIAVRHVLALQRAKTALWVGDRLLCLSDSQPLIGLPENVQSYAEEKFGLNAEEHSTFWAFVGILFDKITNTEEFDTNPDGRLVKPRDDLDFVHKMHKDGTYESYMKLLVP